MAKCIGSIEHWQVKPFEHFNSEFIVESVRDGEINLRTKLNKVSDLLLDIAGDFNNIKQSTTCTDFQIDCTQAQDAILTKLANIQSETLSVIKCIKECKLISPTKHRYFIFYSYGLVESLQQFYQMVGRLSELDQNVFDAEHRKLLVSEESITIHTMTTIWSGTLEIVKRICECAPEVFNSNGEENSDLINQLEFSTFYSQLNKALTMDFIVTSWVRFNQLAKYEELAEGLPLLCPCNFRSFQRILKEVAKSESNRTILADLLPLVLDHESRPSMMTFSSRQLGIVPQEPCYTDAQLIDRFYFVVWFLCSLSRVLGDESIKPMVEKCHDILVDSVENALKMFERRNSDRQQASGFRLSPYQEERLRLLLVLIDHWCEKIKNNLAILTKLLSFINHDWTVFGDNYFDNNLFRINGLTMFQLFTKLIKETIPNDATVQMDTQTAKPEEKQLVDVWNQLLDRIQPKSTIPVGSKKSTTVIVT